MPYYLYKIFETPIRRLEKLGVTDAMVCPWYFYPGDPGSLEHQREGIERFGAEVIERFG